MYNKVKFVLIVCLLFEMYLIHEGHRKEKFFIVLTWLLDRVGVNAAAIKNHDGVSNTTGR